MSEPILDVATAVRELGALPVPVGPEPQPRGVLDRARDALGARMAKDDLRLVLENVIAYAAELEAERHTTNEALSEAAEALRADRDRIAELEADLYTEQVQHRTTLEQRNAHARELLELRARLAEYERPADEDPIRYTLTATAEQLHQQPTARDKGADE
jgi:phage/plasmid-associated DNA primase